MRNVILAFLLGLTAVAAHAAPTDGYTQCAAEHVECVPLAASHVIYGAGAKFTAPIAVTSAFICDNTFQPDPSPGVGKACWIKMDQPASGIALPTITPLVIPTPGVMSMHGGLNIDPRVILPPAVGIAVARIGVNSDHGAPSDIGAFRTECGVAKMAFDDPIVYPGQAGKAHLHTFFGNTGVNANSTTGSLLTTGNSTCTGGTANRTAYWVPTVVDMATGLPVLPTGIGVYYKQGYDIGPSASLQPMPTGLRMIAGNPMLAAPGNPVRYLCDGGPNNENDKYGPSIPDCDAGALMIMQVQFPQCWDGVNLDSPNHQSHMAYPVGPGKNGYARQCPADHPIGLPAVSYNVTYLTPPNHAALKWRLSSDGYDIKLPGGYSGHGDWFNGWDKAISDTWGNNCVRASKDCHSDLLGDGRSLY